MLAIDVGMLMTARSQAQNSADAGALAGAIALIYDDYRRPHRRRPGRDRTRCGRRSANQVMRGQVVGDAQRRDVSARTRPVERTA